MTVQQAIIKYVQNMRVINCIINVFWAESWYTLDVQLYSSCTAPYELPCSSSYDRHIVFILLRSKESVGNWACWRNAFGTEFPQVPSGGATHHCLPPDCTIPLNTMTDATIDLDEYTETKQDVASRYKKRNRQQQITENVISKLVLLYSGLVQATTCYDNTKCNHSCVYIVVQVLLVRSEYSNKHS